MRYELVHAAMINVPGRNLLVNVASRATRLFDRPHTQISETVNEVLDFFHRLNLVAEAVRRVES